MPILNCYVDDNTMLALQRFSRSSGRTVEELAEAAIATEAITALRGTVASIQSELDNAIEDGAELESREQPSMSDFV